MQNKTCILAKNILFMLKSLYIRNYRNLRDFKLEALDRVNLITGKNNTGKSSLLEAIVIYASKGDLYEIEKIIEQHGESLQRNDRANTEQLNFEALSSLFTDRVVQLGTDGFISVGEKEESLFEEPPIANGSVYLRIVKYYDETRKTEDSNLFRRRVIMSDDDPEKDFKLGVQIGIKGSNIEKFYSLDSSFLRRFGLNDKILSDNFQFIKTASIDREINGQLFDEITLTDKERYVIEALKIIEPKTERIAFIEKDTGRNNKRTAIIKLMDSKELYPLKSMGDGINRILTIILALVNSENGYLMIDEFENGLHYTVQEQLWRIIFKLSKDLNIQVFVTTHSEDCISAFTRVLQGDNMTISGNLIRLDNIDGTIKGTSFSPSELKIANNQDIELR